MKLTEVFARKTYGDRSESWRNAKDYIEYAKAGYLSGTSFRIYKDHVVIYQETDEYDDGEEEEVDKYIVTKSAIRPQLWNNFLEVAKAGDQW